MWHVACGMWHGVGMLVWLLIIVLAIFLLVRAFSKNRGASSPAMGIFDGRCAKGDISEEEYLKKKAELET